jgi:hypothetical protein
MRNVIEKVRTGYCPLSKLRTRNWNFEPRIPQHQLWIVQLIRKRRTPITVFSPYTFQESTCHYSALLLNEQQNPGLQHSRSWKIGTFVVFGLYVLDYKYTVTVYLM